jgi:photosystem II stability/assembly factor-like uncharacterized protein
MHLHGILDPSDPSLGAAMQSWFITGAHGWLFVPRKEGSSHWETKDGGRTMRSRPDWNVSTMTFADVRHGLALVRTSQRDLEPMVTADGGETWSRCGVTYSGMYFGSIHLVDALRGWAWVEAPAPRWGAVPRAGNGYGRLYAGVMRTDDGGCHWRGERSSDRELSSHGELDLLNEREGWLAGGHMGGLYQTTDGGLSWQPLRLPEEKMKVWGVHFRDVDHGWIVDSGDRLFETRDGGRTWRHLTRGQVLARLDDLLGAWDRWPIGRLYGMLSRGGCFTSERLDRRPAVHGAQAEGTAVKAPRPTVLTLRIESSAAPCKTYWEQGSAPDGQHAWIGLRSTADGGRTWRIARPSGKAYAADRDEVLGSTISWFIAGDRGWLVLPRDGSIDWTTNDGAKTLRPLPGWWLDKMSFADKRHGAAIVSYRREAEVMLTADGGESWNGCGLKFYDTHFDSVFLLDARHGWASVGAPASHWDGPSAAVESKGPMRWGVMRTEDGGCHWRGEWNVEKRMMLGGDLYFLDEKDGWMVGGYQGGLYHTSDGGTSWHSLPLPARQTEAKGVFFRDADHGWLITEKEELLETRDAGHTWRQVRRRELLSRLDELISTWDRWRIGKLYGMLARGGCFIPAR